MIQTMVIIVAWRYSAGCPLGELLTRRVIRLANYSLGGLPARRIIPGQLSPGELSPGELSYTPFGRSEQCSEGAVDLEYFDVNGKRLLQYSHQLQ